VIEIGNRGGMARGKMTEIKILSSNMLVLLWCGLIALCCTQLNTRQYNVTPHYCQLFL